MGAVHKVSRAPTAIDRRIGANLRRLRRQHHLSQSAIGRLLGVSYQQLQKYEKGMDRIPAAYLYDLSLAFGVPISEFFAVPEGASQTH